MWPLLNLKWLIHFEHIVQLTNLAHATQMYLKRSDYILHTPLDARAEGITNPKSTMVHVYQCCPKTDLTETRKMVEES